MILEKSKARKKQRLIKKIKELLNNNKALFLTLTFNNETLKQTTEEQRQRIVKRYLRNETAYYIANKDYGRKNAREHYHAFIIVSFLTNEEIKNPSLITIKDFINYYTWQKYGTIKGRFIGTKWRPQKDKLLNNFNETALNIFNHFFKDTTKGAKLIYSRKTKTKAEQLEQLKKHYQIRKTKKAETKETNYIDTNNETLKEITEELEIINDYTFKDLEEEIIKELENKNKH